METDTHKRDGSQNGSVPLLTVSKNHKASAEMPTSLLQHNREPAAMEPGNSQLSMTVLMTPDMANFSGNVHGGTAAGLRSSSTATMVKKQLLV